MTREMKYRSDRDITKGLPLASRPFSHITIDERLPHFINDRAGLSFSKLEDAFDDRELSCRSVRPTECSPVIHSHAGSNDLTPSVHSSRNQRDLEERGELIKVLN